MHQKHFITAATSKARSDWRLSKGMRSSTSDRRFRQRLYLCFNETTGNIDLVADTHQSLSLNINCNISCSIETNFSKDSSS